MENYLFVDALQSLIGDGNFIAGPTSGPLKDCLIKQGVKLPTEEEIQAKIAELEALEPLRLLREQRNQLLSQTDWWATTDRTMSNDQQIYRQKLRDLPANTTPSLDSDGQLTNVTWPTKPE